MTWRLPLLSDVPREAWPATLVVVPPDPSIGGDVERVRCGCMVPHRASDIIDLRTAPATLGLPLFLCTHCLHHAAMRGRVTWRALVVGMGCTDPAVLASHDAVDAAHAALRGT